MPSPDQVLIQMRLEHGVVRMDHCEKQCSTSLEDSLAKFFVKLALLLYCFDRGRTVQVGRRGRFGFPNEKVCPAERESSLVLSLHP